MVWLVLWSVILRARKGFGAASGGFIMRSLSNIRGNCREIGILDYQFLWRNLCPWQILHFPGVKVVYRILAVAWLGRG